MVVSKLPDSSSATVTHGEICVLVSSETTNDGSFDGSNFKSVEVYS